MRSLMTVSKNKLGILLIAFLTSPLLGQAPDSLSFQGFLTNAGGDPLDSAGVNITFNMYKGGPSIWTETQSVDVNNGVFNVHLGAVNPLDDVAFDEPIELGITVDGESEMTPRTPLLATAFALGMRGMYAIESTAGTSTAMAVVGGSSNNSITGNGLFGGTIGGGGGFFTGAPVPNAVQAEWATVSGGWDNTASGTESVVSGGRNNLASGSTSVIGGGSSNVASGVATTIGGGGGNSATGTNGNTIAGGISNVAGGGKILATIGGGESNQATNNYATVSGGQVNEATGEFSTVGGGFDNVASSSHATVAGGDRNLASNTDASVGGGQQNTASGTGSTVAGGLTNEANAERAAIAGGGLNTASGIGAFIGGGLSNTASGEHSVVAGGQGNFATATEATVYGGDGNTASAEGATVGGGTANVATGPDATVPGGEFNAARGGTSFAAGAVAKANHNGAFVWQDATGSTTDTLATDGVNQFLARASGGYTLLTSAAPDTKVGAFLAGGSGTWADLSSESAKNNFQTVDPVDYLNRLDQIEIREWSYKTESGVTHVGPMAEEFHAAFGHGPSEHAITTVDGNGVALAAIQGLYELVKEQQAEIERLRELVEGN